MTEENIRGTASISQNEENVKSIFEKIFGNAEAQTNADVNTFSEKSLEKSEITIYSCWKLNSDGVLQS